MRPEDFSPGNPAVPLSGHRPAIASMRPEDFSPGNIASWIERRADPHRFNEAGGFLPRKPWATVVEQYSSKQASMRPEDFSPGNPGGGRPP